MIIQDKILLITGGTGSFGNAVLNRFLHTDHFKEIRIFSRDEKKQDDMRNQLKNDKLKFYIGDVRDYSSVERAMRGVDYVFHAAALKQVPSCEFFPLEATKTNVFGTQNVIDAALEQCERTQNTTAEVTPEAVAKMVKAFAEFSVTKQMIEKRIQRRIDVMTPAQMVSLRKVYRSLADGMGKADDFFEMAPDFSAPSASAAKPEPNQEPPK